MLVMVLKASFTRPFSSILLYMVGGSYCITSQPKKDLFIQSVVTEQLRLRTESLH